MHTLKVATKDDIEIIKKLYNNFLGLNPIFGDNAPEDKVLQEYAETFLDESTPDKMLVIAYDEDEPVGLIAFSYHKDNFGGKTWGTRNMIFIEPSHRQKGLSTELMEAFETWAHTMKCYAIQLDVLHDELYNKMIESYEALGFKPVNTTCIKEL